MKLSGLMLVVGAISFAVGFTYHNPGDPANRENSKREESSVVELRQQLNKANARANCVEVTEIQTEVRVIRPVGVITNPIDIIDALIAIEKNTPPLTNKRIIIHHFQSLRDQGDAALVPIEAFLKRNVDREYYMEMGTWRKHLYNVSASSVLVRPIDPEPALCPRTLRLGLIDVLAQHGEQKAETILAATLRTTASGAELAVIAQHLEKLAPGQYTQMALENAATLLLKLPHIAEPNRFDDLSRNFLVGLLLKHKDQTYLIHARKNLFDANDRLDTLHLNYINALQHEACIPLLRELYNNYDLNRADRGVARDLALRQYLGVDNDVTRDFLTHIQACCNVYPAGKRGISCVCL
ncbi:MAG: hypothetical protein H8E27_06735 [Verrucomicrobia subdivision 3 bacterium]|nr:hypothetical protein [Limisphaerales bacterium]